MKLGDRTVKVLLTVITVLLGLNLLVQLHPAPRVAMAAGIPDTGAQLQAIVDELQTLNKKVDKIDAVLESGNLTVKVKDAKGDKSDK